MKPHELQTASAIAVATLAAAEQRRQLSNRLLIQAAGGVRPFDARIVDVDGRLAIAWQDQGLTDDDAIEVARVLHERDCTATAGDVADQDREFLEVLEADRRLSDGGEVTFDGALLKFMQLVDGSALDVLAFVQEYGPLRMCNHGLPVGHPEFRYHRPVGSVLPRGRRVPAELNQCTVAHCVVAGADIGEKEALPFVPISTWMEYATRFHAITAGAAALHEGRSIGADAWNAVGSSLRWYRWPAYSDSIDTQGRAIQLEIDRLVDVSQLQPRVRLSADSPPHIELRAAERSDPLFAALCYQLLLHVSQIDAIRICNSCGSIITTKYSRKYCRPCGKRAADRDAQKRRRARAHDGNVR